jgi:hypothetical protein
MLENPGNPKRKKKSKAITKIRPAKIKRHTEVLVSDLSKLDRNSTEYKKLAKRYAKQQKRQRIIKAEHQSNQVARTKAKKVRSFYKTPIPNLLEESEDKTIYIIGGGPSLKEFNWKLLEGKNVLCVNRAFQVVPWALATFWTDSRFYRWYQTELKEFNGIKVACRYSQLYDKDVILVKSTGGHSIDLDAHCVKAGNNSGYGALNVAFHLGAKKIYLLGYDMWSDAGKTHWHDGYITSHNHGIYDRAMIGDFSKAQAHYKKVGINLYNANPKSRLESIKKCSIKEAIEDLMP